MYCLNDRWGFNFLFRRLVGTALKTMLGGVYYFLQDTRIPEKMQKENIKKFVGEGVKKLSNIFHYFDVILVV